MPSDLINIQEAIDPRLLQVNRRLKGGHWIKPETKAAMDQLSLLAAQQVSGRTWIPTKMSRFVVSLEFTFPTSNSDIDGPIKRTIDAVFTGMRKVVDLPHVNDSRITSLWVRKFVGEPFLCCFITEIDA